MIIRLMEGFYPSVGVYWLIILIYFSYYGNRRKELRLRPKDQGITLKALTRDEGSEEVASGYCVIPRARKSRYR